MTPKPSTGSSYYFSAIESFEEGDLEEGLSLLYLSANRRCLMAMRTLAWFYESNKYGIPRDLDLHKHWYRLSNEAIAASKS